MELQVEKGHWPERLRRLEEAGWRVVPDEDYARTPGRQMVLHERFISCHIPDSSETSALIYNATGPGFAVEDFASSRRAWFSLVAHTKRPIDLIADLRRLTLVENRFTELMRQTPAGMMEFPPTLERVSLRRTIMLLPDDISRHYWAGLFGRLVTPTPILVNDLDEAWLLTEAIPDERLACERAAEIAFGNSDPSMTEQVARRLEAEPGLELAAVAKTLGLSPRSLQRRLTEEGIRFAALRDEARLRRANALVEAGAKVEAIAREVGFSSTSYFIQWYRSRTRRTPGGRSGRARDRM